MSEHTIREARTDDAAFIAWAILTAVGNDSPTTEMLQFMEKICSRADTLYSWRNTMIAEQSGQTVGALTSYDGARYDEMRKITFPLFAQRFGNDYSTMEAETAAGEFYLDSMAVLPQFRKRGIATTLLRAGIQLAKRQSIPQTAMFVSPHNPNAQRLYESLGFRYERNMLLFGEDYRKMVLHLNE